MSVATESVTDGDDWGSDLGNSDTETVAESETSVAETTETTITTETTVAETSVAVSDGNWGGSDSDLNEKKPRLADRVTLAVAE